ncbi:MAG: Ig-like domain-containing protein [Bacteroides sp.]|nr:Ig-like domain-containing protein [Bacteroides sp.]MCM1378494.1 Ig-like domain-containing protein [Bacteroides sp.]MCM1444795.1 Ig-like domain-containing protein [Prevotella sp.]
MIKRFLLAAMVTTAAAAWADSFVATTITDGKFAPDTEWYTMQIHTSGYYLSNEVNANGAMPLLRKSTFNAAGDLWCFVGNDTDGYKIYNRAEGPGKSLAAPIEMKGTTGADSYPVLKAPGEEGNCYDWVFTTGSIAGSYFIGEKGYANNRINVRNGQLAFWTDGADNGSSIVIKKVYFAKIDGDALLVNEEPRTTLSGTIAPTVNADGSIVLGNCDYHFTSPEGKTVLSYTLSYPDGTSKTVTGRGEVKDDLTVSGPAVLDNVTARVIDLQGQSDNGYIVFRYNGTPGFDIVYRIPSIVTVLAGDHKGRVFAVNDYRYCGGDIGAGRIDLYQSYSDDNGKTWTVPDVVRGVDGQPIAMGTGNGTPAGTKQSVTNLDCGFGDPATVCDRETGELFMVACAGRMNFFSSRRADPQPSARWWSTDGGETWTEPDFTQWEQIYSLFDDNCTYGYIDGQFIGSGRMVQSSKVKVGSHYRLYAVMSGRNAAAGNISNWVLYSDDFGHNWKILGDPYNPAISYNADEPKCEELPDGSILLAARGNGGGRNFNIFHYSNIENGEGHWGDQINSTLGTGHGINACNGEIMIIPVKNAAGEKAHLAIQSFTNSSAREKVTLAYKALRTPADYDKPEDFQTWDGFYQLTPKPSAYSTMILQEDKTIGVLFEESTYNNRHYVDSDGVAHDDGNYDFCEVYRNLSIPELTGNTWEYDDKPQSENEIKKEAVENKLDEVSGYEGSPIVGLPTAASIANVKTVGNTYLADPTEENYLAFNAAYDSMELTMPRSGGIYSFTNAHGGKYNISGDRWLAAGATTLSVKSAEDATTKFVVFNPADNADEFLLYNESLKVYAKPTPEEVSTAVSTATKSYNAGTYKFVVSNGKVALSCTTPGKAAYPALHMDGSQKVVIWTEGEAASKWVMTLLGMAEELPEADKPTVTAITFSPASVSLTVGETATVTATITPESAATTELLWASANEAVATVSATGEITAVAPGQTTVTVTANDADKFSKSLTVNVIEQDGIRDIINGQPKADREYYDLQGRRVLTPRRGQFLLSKDNKLTI